MPKQKQAKEPLQVERKFTWGATAAVVYGGLVSWFYNNPHALDAYLPTWARTLLLVAVGVGGVGGAIYTAPHTTRPDVAKASTAEALFTVTEGSHEYVAPSGPAWDGRLDDFATDATKPFTGHTPSPYEEGTVIQDPDVPEKPEPRLPDPGATR